MRIKRAKDEYTGDRKLALDSRLAIGYARGSTEEQVNSCPRQRELFLAKSRAMDYEIIAIVEDPGISGEKTKVLERPQFQAVLQQCLAEACFHIFVEDIKRFSRNALDRYITCDFLWKQHGISVHFLNQGLVSSRAQDKMVIALLSEIAEDDNRSRRDYCEQTRAMLRKQSKRCSGRPSYGWELDPFKTYQARAGREMHHWRPIEAEQQALNLIFNMVAMGWNTTAMAKHLNHHGIKPKCAPRYLPGGQQLPSSGQWYPSTVQSVLEHARHQDGRTCTVDPQPNGGRLKFTIVMPEAQPAAVAA